MEEMRESPEEQVQLFKKVQVKIRNDRKKISELSFLSNSIMPAISSLTDGIANQITELNASLNAVIRKAAI